MGLLKLFKKLRKTTEEEDFDTVQFEDDSSEYNEQSDGAYEEMVDVSGLSEKELETYVKSQCEAMEDANRYITALKQEYDTVADYYSDIQMIDNSSDETKKQLETLSKAISELTVDRRMYKGSENKLSNHKYYKMEMAEKDMPKALIDMQNNETYVDTVTKDMHLLEGEKMSIKMDIRELNKRKNNIRQLGKMITIIMGAILIVLIAVNLATPDEPNYAFLIVCGIAVLVVLILFTLGQTVNKGLMVARKKYAKCITLLNKVKIKYINAANTLDYSYSKYDVKNSYEFSRQYELYLTMKAEQKKMLELTEELNYTEERLLKTLKRLQLNDCEIWLKQVRALADPKEMVEIRHSLSVRRKKLREQIEFNRKKYDECKNNIMKVTERNPQYQQLVLSILDRFDG